MPLAAGTRLGPYEIVAPLGAGGMGEVYRARDSRLGRDVAVKVLPASLSSSPEVRARFEREARTVSGLNHPHICVLHDVGREGDTAYLVMELVEGQTLAATLARGPLPVAETLRIGAQIADALERAHRAGVIHRDLKPGNVMLGKSGAKLMDFGLARATGPAAPAGAGATAAMTQSPTVSAPLTAEGTIVGTFQYMAPEQLEGQEADARSDLWALGCVLYEMATGRRAYEGRTQASLIGAIMRDSPPPISQLVPMAPPAFDRVVRQCLAKDPDQRWQTAGDLRRELLWLAEAGATRGAAPGAAPRGRSWWAPAALAAVALVAAGWLGGRLLPLGERPAAASRVGAMLQLTDMPGREFSPCLSADGKMLLYVAIDGGDEDIFLLRVGGENPINLTEGHDGADYDPAFSPDGERIAFGSAREGGGIFVMGATGESPRKISGEGAHPAWSPDGRKIAYSTERILTPYGRGTVASLWVVDLATGEKRRIYEGDAVEPAWSPSGKRIAFWAADQGQRDIRTIPAEGGVAKAVTQDIATDWNPFWAPDGRSLYFLSDRGGSLDLWRVAIDEATGAVRGDPAPVTTGVARVMAGSISGDGRRIAIMVDEARSEIVRMGFDPAAARPLGTPVSLFATSKTMTQMEVSPDGGWIAYRTEQQREDVMVMRSDGTGRRRLTDDEFRNRGPDWIRGNEWLVFYSNRSGKYEAWLTKTDGTEQRMMTSFPEGDVTLPIVSPDGTQLALSVLAGGKQMLAIARVAEEWFTPGRTPEPAAVDTVVAGFVPQSWSPDGASIAGIAMDRQGPVPAVYSLATRRVERRRDLPGPVFFGSTWLPDGRRILSWDPLRSTAIVWRTDAPEVWDIRGIPGPSELRLTADGRTLLMNRTVLEADVWMLTLK